MRQIYKCHWLGLLLLLGAWLWPGAASAADITAREMFALLPDSIFENTPEGLPESEKQQLLASGSSEFWEISEEMPDMLVFTALPFRDRSIGLRLFRNAANGSVEAAFGTLGEPICSLELWRRDSSGRIVPVDTPPEPDISEFFITKRKLPAHIHNSVQICLRADGLGAVPLFWNQHGMLPARLEREVAFVWNGRAFEKRIANIARPGGN